MSYRTNTDRSEGGIGPQSDSDGPLRRRLRRHQSWYRERVLQVPYGTGPKSSDSTFFGNMLNAVSAESGLNFLSPEIYELAKSRISESTGLVDSFRLLRNMLSSHPMCFNLFGQMALDLDLATVLARALWGTHVGKVTAVKFEWAPTPISEYLNDRTAFDAMIEYESSDGLGFIGIETKLSEDITSEETNRGNYSKWLNSTGPWHVDALSKLEDVTFNQIWRNHLLAWSLMDHDSSNYTSGSFTVIHHPEDEKCRHLVNEYRNLLDKKDSFQSFGLEECVAAWRPYATDWAAKFEERYLDLGKSDSGDSQPT